MAPQRGSQVAAPPSDDQGRLSTAYSLLLLSEYTHTLDSLPLDLSRNFADLRELDAVLSSSMHSITSKVHNLTQMIEQGTASKEERLWLLTEISEEASRLKLGGEDKIRVACQAADNLKAHSNHLRSLADHLPGFDSSVLNRKTVYPHVSAQSFMPVHTFEHGRRRRNGLGSLLTATSNNTDPSPAKRKRVNRDDDIDIGNLKSPRKDKVESNSRARPPRVRKTDRALSPSESVISAANPLPSQNNQGPAKAANSRSGGAASNNKRSRGGAGNNNRNQTPLANEYIPGQDQRSANTSISTHNGSRRDGYNVPASSNQHPSLPLPYPNGTNGLGGHQQIMQTYDMHGISHLQSWAPPSGQQLEGPGMPVARNTSVHAPVAATPATPMNVDNGADGADADGDGDDTRYCLCNGVSYGEMIGCDGESCEREWFHLACTGLSAPPSGNWFCEDCKAKRNAKRTARGGKRRATGSRAGAKST